MRIRVGVAIYPIIQNVVSVTQRNHAGSLLNRDRYQGEGREKDSKEKGKKRKKRTLLS